MEGEVDEAVSLFFREGGEIGKQDEPVRQPPAPEPDGEQLPIFRRRHWGEIIHGVRFQNKPFFGGGGSSSAQPVVGCNRAAARRRSIARFYFGCRAMFYHKNAAGKTKMAA